MAYMPILASALLSSLLTAIALLLVYKLHLRGELDQLLSQTQLEFERRVKLGAVAAGEELLPKFREQVSLGFQDALAKSQTAGLMEKGAGAMNLGADLLGNSLGAFLGIKAKK